MAGVHLTTQCVELFRLNGECFFLLWITTTAVCLCWLISVLAHWKFSFFYNAAADHFHTCLPVTMAQWSRLVDSCVCCRLASWLGWAGRSESQPGRLRWSGWFSGHTGPAASAALLHSSGCTPPTLLQTSWDNTTQGRWVNMHGSSITSSDRPAGIHKWYDNCAMIAIVEDSLRCI